MDEKTAFAERLRAAIEAAGYEARPAVVEREFNQRYWGHAVTFQAVRRWLRGESIPAQDKLQVLAEWLKVEPQALRFGMESVQRVRTAKAAFDYAVSYGEREVIEAFLALPADRKKIVRDVILTYAAHSQSSKPGEPV